MSRLDLATTRLTRLDVGNLMRSSSTGAAARQPTIAARRSPRV
jgi:hypothetical protein